jgi:hypothetical protein
MKFTENDILDKNRINQMIEKEALSIYNKIEAGELNFPEYTRWGIEVS